MGILAIRSTATPGGLPASPTAQRWMRAAIATMLVPACVTIVHAAAVYRWVDADGQVHFSDRPDSADAEKAEISVPHSPGSSGADRHQRTQRLLDDMASERQERKDERDQRAEEAKQRQAACSAARQHQFMYEQSSRIFRFDDEGNRHYLDDAEREARQASLRAEVARWCDSL